MAFVFGCATTLPDNVSTVPAQQATHVDADLDPKNDPAGSLDESSEPSSLEDPIGGKCPDRSFDRKALFDALRRGLVFDDGRQTVHVSHTCNLKIEGDMFWVMDVRELVPSAVVCRGVNQIVVLDPSLRVVQKIHYDVERPLYCVQNQLILHGDLAIDNIGPEGNVLTFTEGGKRVSTSRVDTNALPGEAQ